MKHCNRCNTTKESSEFHKATARKDGLQANCKECEKVRRKQYYADNREGLLAYSKQHYTANREEYLANGKQWRTNNPERARDMTKQWVSNNPVRRAAINALSGAVLRGGKASDIYDVELCMPFYEEARRLTLETGIKYEVDHIIPVSKGGLHDHTNLQVLTLKDNREKGATHAKKKC